MHWNNISTPTAHPPPPPPSPPPPRRPLPPPRRPPRRRRRTAPTGALTIENTSPTTDNRGSTTPPSNR